MKSIISISLDKESAKIVKKLNKIRPYGWLSKDFRDFLKTRFGTDKKILISLLNDLQKQRDKTDDKIKELAKKINKLK